MSGVLADLILALHVLYASFVVGGFLVLPLGWCLRWGWVRAWPFRLAHLGCTALVAVEAVIGLTCPLTWLEQLFLIAAGQGGYDRSFVGRLLYGVLYYDAPAWVFTAVYVILALSVAGLLFAIPPRHHSQARRREAL